MNTGIYYPFLWVFIFVWVAGIFFINRILSGIQQRVLQDTEMKGYFITQIGAIGSARLILWATTIILVGGGAGTWFYSNLENQHNITAKRQQLWPVYEKGKVWEAPDPYLEATDNEAKMIAYGRQLIAQTQDYFGINGIVRARSINAMNCQNCHLDAGTKPFGNNYFGVASTYPQMRRSGALETIPKRVNDCFQRSLNGQPIDTTSREMKAILAYMRWLGTAVPKGEKPKGSGLVEVPFLDRAADPVQGQQIYVSKCVSCHGTDGHGLPMPGSSRQYPPLWGNGSYNQAAGLFRLSRLAGYVKANMPFGANYQNPQLTDEEAWDVAAFINSQPRPLHPFLKTDWPKIEKKPFDHPFGPYADPYPEIQHKFGPFGEIVAFYPSKEKKNNNMPSNRRKFLRNALLTSVGAGVIPLQSNANDLTSSASTPGTTNEAPMNGTLSILQTTDVHCQIHPHDELFWENDKAVFRKTAGYAHIATLFDKVRKQNPNTFIVDTGDMFQGSELSVKTTGKAFLPILNSLGYDLYLPGNWEVVYYKKNMQTLLGGLDAPKVCANMYHDAGDGKKGELIFPPYYTWSKLGVKIGFLGYTDPLVPLRQSPAYSKGIIYTKPEENLAYYVNVLREQEQCDYVIILSHLGLSQQIALANMPECEGVNYIFGGDTHERVREPIVCKYAKVVEPGAFGSFVGRLDLTVKDGKITEDHYELMEVNSEKYRAKKEITALIGQLEAPFMADIERVVGYSKVPLYRYFVVENTIDTLILDALAWKVGTEIVLSNGFRFCPPRSTPNSDGLIPITEGYIFDMLPVDATVRTAKVTGAELLKWLEKELNNVFAKDASKRFGGWLVKFRGMEVSFNAFGEQDKRVQEVTVGGQPLDPERSYTVAACERDGDPVTMLCRIPKVSDGKNLPYSLHPVLKEYLAANSPVSPIPRGAAKILDAPATLLTQVSGVSYTFR